MKILCLCDSPTIVSGFSRVAQNLFRRWAADGAVIHCWGIAFQGWGYKLHPYVDTFFPGGLGVAQDHWAGQQRLQFFLKQLEIGGYTHVWILQDTFQLVNFDFPVALRRICDSKNIKSMFYFPVDAPLDPEWTDIIAAVDVPVAFTEFGRTEAMDQLRRRRRDIDEFNGKNPPEQQIRTPGLDYGGAIHVLPHGVDTAVYRPLADRSRMRDGFWQEKFAGPDDFLMVNVNVNQRRKDTARSLQLLKEVRALGVPAKLIMHMACRSDDGLDLEIIGRQLGLRIMEDWAHHDHLFAAGQGKLTEEQLVRLYNVADLYLTTTLGEGWGLGITEALACGTPVAMPMHTSCREIAEKFDCLGMGSQVVPLPLDAHATFQGLDMSRMRHRVEVLSAARVIAKYYHSGEWRQRPGLNQGVRDWLSWGRIAREMLGLMKREAVTVNEEAVAS